MAKNKTHQTSQDVMEFLSKMEDQRKYDGSVQLIEIMQEISGHEPKMWGPSIIGFGSYHYKYASGHEGDAPVIGFSPRKAAYSLYVYTGRDEHRHLLDDLGKFTMGKVCIYVKKLEDINMDSLRKLIEVCVEYVKDNSPTC
jgi:hypothetical protein